MVRGRLVCAGRDHQQRASHPRACITLPLADTKEKYTDDHAPQLANRSSVWCCWGPAQGRQPYQRFQQCVNQALQVSGPKQPHMQLGCRGSPP